LTEKSQNIRSYTGYIYGSDQLYTYDIMHDDLRVCMHNLGKHGTLACQNTYEHKKTFSESKYCTTIATNDHNKKVFALTICYDPSCSLAATSAPQCACLAAPQQPSNLSVCHAYPYKINQAHQQQRALPSACLAAPQHPKRAAAPHRCYYSRQVGREGGAADTLLESG